MINNFFNIFTIFNDAPQPFQIGFQDSAAPGFTGIVELHNTIFFYLVFISVAVFWVLASTIYYFKFIDNKKIIKFAIVTKILCKKHLVKFIAGLIIMKMGPYLFSAIAAKIDYSLIGSVSCSLFNTHIIIDPAYLFSKLVPTPSFPLNFNNQPGYIPFEILKGGNPSDDIVPYSMYVLYRAGSPHFYEMLRSRFVALGLPELRRLREFVDTDVDAEVTEMLLGKSITNWPWEERLDVAETQDETRKAIVDGIDAFIRG
jgi:hypothetical protein